MQSSCRLWRDRHSHSLTLLNVLLFVTFAHIIDINIYLQDTYKQQYNHIIIQYDIILRGMHGMHLHTFSLAAHRTLEL